MIPERFFGSPATAAGIPTRDSFLVISQLIKKAFISTRNIIFGMEHLVWQSFVLWGNPVICATRIDDFVKGLKKL
jgi:hypothetical protein